MHGDLVGRVQHAGRGASGDSGSAGEAEAGERVVVDRLERQRADLGEVQPLDRHVDALGVVQRVGDRHAHVGMAEVRERRAVDQRDHAVDDRLRVHDDVDALVRDAEQMVGLDDLEALVHQRRRVDRDLAAHLPRRVLERLIDRDVLQLGARASAKGSARCGQHELLDGPRPLARQQLVQRRVLGVDGQDLRAGRLGERHHKLAADDERLLVGEREVDALAERRDRRAEAGRADERVEHEVGVGLEHQLDEPLGARQHLAVGPLLRCAGAGVGVGERDPADAEAPRLVDQRIRRALGGQADELEVGVAGDDFQGLRADRAGRAEDEQTAGHDCG